MRLSVFARVQILLAIGAVSPYNTGVYRPDGADSPARAAAGAAFFLETRRREPYNVPVVAFGEPEL
jgi:hypothetical protein